MPIEIAFGAILGACFKGGELANKVFQRNNDLEKYYEEFKESMTTLGAIKEDHEDKVVKGRSENKVASRDYELWKKRVCHFSERSRHMCLRIDRKLPKLGIFGRSSLYNRIKENEKKIQRLISEGRTIQVLVDKPPEEPLKKIVRYLVDNTKSNIKVIGVCGNGKTSLLKQLKKDKKVKRSFRRVVLVEDLKHNDVQNLQHEIARQFDLKITAKEDYAKQIRKKLQSHTYLLILIRDHQIDLNKVGILDTKTKLVFASHSRHACEKYMPHRIVQL